MTGYAVVDLETTGIHPGRHERIVEVAVVHVSPRGAITGAWETLINPGRDLGPQRIHGVRAAEILRAPTFGQVAGELAALLRGRVVVAHNLRFDAGFLAAEYLRCGHEVPIAVEHGLCTMGLAHRYLPGSGRSLLDRHISVTESDGLVAVATELGMGRAAAQELHACYVRQLAQVAWADGVITETERGDLHSVGHLLGIGGAEIDRLLAESRPIPGSTGSTAHMPTIGAFALSPGDLVVFTGEMSRLRSEWEQDAAEVGLVPHGAVTKKVALLVAADPDSLSGKARKARDYGIPVVTEDGFARMLAEYQRVAAHSVSYV